MYVNVLSVPTPSAPAGVEALACTCSCAARAWASLNNELLIGWGSGTPCGAKPGMRTEGCAILDSSGWVVRTRGHKRVARVAVGRYDVEQPGAGVGHAEGGQ